MWAWFPALSEPSLHRSRCRQNHNHNQNQNQVALTEHSFCLASGAQPGGGARGVASSRRRSLSAQRATGRQEDSEASRDAENRRGDVAAQRDRRLPGQVPGGCDWEGAAAQHDERLPDLCADL